MAHQPAQLWLIRHAESAGNIANAAAIADGRPELDLAQRDMDVPLSELGRRQANALGTWIRSLPEPPEVVFCSPYLRALDTARLGLEEAPVRYDERLREREFGILDRLTKVGIEARHPEQAAARAFLGKFFHRPPGGESWTDVAGRIRSFLTDLRLDHDGCRVAVVTHQVVITLFRYVLEDLDETAILALDRQQEIANTAVTSYRCGPGGRLALEQFNDTAHLPPDLRTAEPDVPARPR